MNTVSPNSYQLDLNMLRDEQDEEGDDMESEHGEGREPKIKSKPELPSELEVERHYAANHCPYRNWCKHCVMGQAPNTGHRSIEREEEDQVSTVSIDYGYLVNSGDSADVEEDVELLRWIRNCSARSRNSFLMMQLVIGHCI